MLAPVGLAPFTLAIGSTGSAEIPLALPVLAGDGTENLFPRAEAVGRHGAFALFRDQGWLLGVATRPVDGHIEASTSALYADLMSATRGRHLARVWNYVPAINAPGPGGLENYRAFCRGRSCAFESEFGADFSRFAPAASGVGCDGDRLVVVFVACDYAVRHIENPFQVPAYSYPPLYGPRSPTFARATVVEHPGGRTVFISGTSAIRGHSTIAPDDSLAQLRCTLDNLAAIARAAGLGHFPGPAPVRQHVRVYLRHASDRAAVAAALSSAWAGFALRISYLRSDICRRELNVEIEVAIQFAAE